MEIVIDIQTHLYFIVMISNNSFWEGIVAAMNSDVKSWSMSMPNVQVWLNTRRFEQVLKFKND